jgi:hypothetical protein
LRVTCRSRLRHSFNATGVPHADDRCT